MQPPIINDACGSMPADSTLELRTSLNTEGEVQRVLGKLENNGLDLPINRLMANSDAAFRPFILMANGLLNSGQLAPHLRECVILALAARLDVAYEWREHVTISKRAGVTDGERSALAKPLELTDDRLSAETRASIAAAFNILDGTLQDAEWRSLCERLGKQAAFELVLVVAWWGGMVPIILKTVADRFNLVAAIKDPAESG
jgi:alkylhydroperoxidase/carboxymuconolactone decarboxylase family protein YurZ